MLFLSLTLQGLSEEPNKGGENHDLGSITHVQPNLTSHGNFTFPLLIHTFE